MKQHTPTPWQADPDDREGYEWNIHILDSSGVNRICFMSNGPQTQANADFIVKAVNSHERLVVALEEISRGGAELARGIAAEALRETQQSRG